ncbi:transporter substrate-binding domain-containing protein [Pseudoalteromonas sp. C2R02]|uniref:transporter substrate-binding domain-containing protein n=1 Tax=Pseudoalteromonas sp. C2R02 TaxID=2841565 RepID=UPI001C0805ED|nr:transporter substrate-binding domain-containing protein [Pseudoalteromonas sp. C2R02]MBU2972453.1 transporter substrate-binding domain-containing protein [Pseudoalteromonas sp. C2R02]
MKILIFLVLFPIISFAETLSVALYENHDDYYKYSRSYKLSWDLLKLATEQKGITLKAEPYLWLRGLNSVESNKVDALLGVSFSEDRKKIGYFSQPLSVDRINLYSKQSKSLTLEQLITKKVLVGVTTKSIGEELANKLGFMQVYRKSSSFKVFDLLIKDKIQYAIFSGSVANKHCMIMELEVLNESCMTAMQPSLATTTMHALYNQTSRVKGIAKEIASAIDKLINSGKVKELFLESNYSEQEYKDWVKLRDDWLNQNN